MTPKEYIQRQIFTAGTRARVSAIKYYEDDEHTYCPFCGSEQEQRSKNGVFHIGCKPKLKNTLWTQVLKQQQNIIWN